MDRINRRISRITRARSVEDLAKRLQKILRALAYFAAQSQGAVVDFQEDWREAFASELRREMGI